MLVVGMTGCGKTFYVLKMIVDQYMFQFGYIIIVCPTFSRNMSYRQWKYLADRDVIIVECDHESVNYFLTEIRDIYEDTNSLIIIDDCAASKDIRDRTSEVVNLAFSGRHCGLSTIVITQQLTSIAKPFRENISKLVCFYNPNRKDMKTIFDEYLDGVSIKEYDDIKKALRSNKYARLEIDLVSPYDYKVVIPENI